MSDAARIAALEDLLEKLQTKVTQLELRITVIEQNLLKVGSS